MAKLQVGLFGSPEVQIDGRPASGFDSDKVRALLAYLVVESDRPHRRQQLASLLWPDFPERSARTNLRRALSNLRQVIGDHDADPPYLLVTRQTLQFNAASLASIDVARFTTLQQGHRDQAPTAVELEEAASLARGPFMEGFSLPDSASFEEWQRLTAESLKQQLLRILHRLAAHYEDLGQYEEALPFARRQVELEPYQEEAHQQVMRLLLYSGRRAESLAQFEMLKETLAVELDVAPSPESAALYDRIQAGEESPAPVGRAHGVRGYELQELLGSGRFGAVYRAHQPVIGREVAVKIILPEYADNPDFIRRFMVEAQLVARLEHPHIVPLYDYWRQPGGAFLVMRWLRGGSLQQALQRGPWNLAPTVQLVQQVASALHFAHRQGVIHRDIKPANILLDEPGNAYLSDFGVATLVGPWGSLETDLPAAGSSASGSLGYLSPETIEQETPTAAADIYSLGVVIYELLTAQHPFPGYHGQELLDKHLREPFPAARLLHPELPPAVDGVIQRATAKDPRKRYADAQELASDLQRAAAIAPQPLAAPREETVPSNPYKGLRPFQEADAADFFGRSALIEQLLSRMEDGRPGDRFLALVGPSGSGKSSVIAAGLLPALRRGALPGSDDWFVAQMVPGLHPLDELEIALLRIAVGQPAGLMEHLRRDERGLIRAASLALPDEDSQLLLIIDQFEEIFTLAADSQERAILLQLLVAAATQPRSQMRILVSLRADFYDRPLMHADLGQLMRARTEVVVPLDAKELSQAIVEPAVRAGVQIEPELLTTMVAEVGEQPGALPLLQYALTELFESRDNQHLSLTAYRSMGGVRGALGRRAEELYRALDEDGQQAVWQLFLRLVTLGEGTEDTRRRVLRSELMGIGPAPVMETVLERYGRYRLLTFDRDPLTREPTVEVAHEALLRDWPRLRQWLDEDRDDVRLQRRLAVATAEWVHGEMSDDYLLRGSRLDLFIGWYATTRLALTQEEQAFLEASEAARQQRRAEEEARRQRELETAQQLVQEQTKRAEEQEAAAQGLRRRALLLTGALVIAAILAIAAVFFANQSNRNAQAAVDNADLAAASAAEANANAGLAATREAEALTNARLAADNEAQAVSNANLALTREAEAEAQRALAEQEAEQRAIAQAEAQNVALVAGSQAALANNDTDTALALAWQAVALNPDSALAQAQLSEAAYTPGTVRILSGNKAGMNRVYVSPDGQTVFGVGLDGSVILWDMETGQIRWQEQVFTADEAAEGIKVEGNDGGFSPDGLVVAATYDDRIMFWDASSGQLIRQIDSAAFDQKIEFSPTGDQFATIGKEDQSRLVFWDSASGETLRELDRGSNIEDFKYTADGSAILLANQTGDLTLLDTETGDVIYEVQADMGSGAGPLFYVDISPDGSRVLGNFSNIGMVIWDLNTGEQLHDFRYADGIFAVEFHPYDGTVLASGQGIQTIDPQTGEILRANASQSSAIFHLTIAPDGRQAVTTALDGTVRVWDLQEGQVIRQYPAPDALLFEVALSPDGRTVLAGSTDGSATLWDVESGEEIWRIQDDQPIMSVAFSPDGRQALTGGGYRLAQKIESGHIILWDVETGQEIRRFEGHPYAIFAVDFSPDGRLAASAGNGAITILWDVETGQEIRRFEDYWEDYMYPDNSYWSVQFSPDGQRLFASHSGGAIISWDVASGQLVQRLEEHAQGGKFLFNEDGQRLVSGSTDSQAILWDVPTGTALRRFTDRAGGVGKVPFSPDETLLLGGGGDGISSLWNIESGEEIRRYGGGFAFSPDFTPDGHRAVVGYRDGRVALWRIDATLDELLTWTENNRYIPDITCEQRQLYRIEPLCE